MTRRVRDVMSRDVVMVSVDSSLITVSPDDGEWYAVELMRLHAVRRLPVLDHGGPAGVLSLGVLAIDLERDSAPAAISAAPPNSGAHRLMTDSRSGEPAASVREPVRGPWRQATRAGLACNG
ncbi:CBS domain-containing protein [Nonomuraea polychroma]|uniref:CBS domain-containing protein n=1 Tax=Nonomuraea polychroma TaxID=46176 RepID=UPI000FDEFE00|nr:CBS domain-containing protein [Nonomuraea polychroma]